MWNADPPSVVKPTLRLTLSDRPAVATRLHLAGRGSPFMVYDRVISRFGKCRERYELNVLLLATVRYFLFVGWYWYLCQRLRRRSGKARTDRRFAGLSIAKSGRRLLWADATLILP